MSQLWFLTGTSSGMGNCLVKQLLAANHKVAATSRSVPRLVEAVGQNKGANFLPLEVDLNSEESIKKAIDETLKHFNAKTIDVVVNCAGYDTIGSVEEFTVNEVQTMFNVNCFTVHKVVRNVLPYMRAAKSGLIINISSIAALTPPFLSGIYGAAKAALSAMTEALAQEVAPFNIKVLLIEPGPFETKFYNKTNIKCVAHIDPAYQSQHDQRALPDNRPKMPGDPERAAKIIIEVSQLPEMPKLLFLGKPCISYAEGKADLIKSEITKYKKYIEGADFQ